MSGLEIAAAAASIGGSIVSGLGQMQAGKAAKVGADFQAAQMRQQAGQERAASQRVAIEKRREATIAQSRAQAVAAASGGGATDKTVLDLTGGLAQQGEYNALSALFEGEESARGMELGATSAQMQGKQAKKAGMIGGMTTIASGIGSAGLSLADKYNPSAASRTVTSTRKYDFMNHKWTS